MTIVRDVHATSSPSASHDGGLTRGVPRPERDPARPVYVISVAASIVSAHPRTLRIYEDEGLLCPARTPTNIRLYSENDIRRILWIRHLTRERGVNLAGIRILFELEERLGARILEALYAEGTGDADGRPATPEPTLDVDRGTRSRRPPTRPVGDPRWPSDRPTPVDEQPSSDHDGPRDLPLVALRETVIFPEMIVPLQVGREKSVNALNAAVAEGGPIALVTQRQAEQEDIDDPSELYADRHAGQDRPGRPAPGRHRPGIVQGQSRLRVRGFTPDRPYLRASIEELPDESPTASRSRR